MKRLALALAALLGFAGVGLAAEGAVRWTEMPELASAATSAAGDGASATVLGDPGVGCFRGTVRVTARKPEREAVIRGFAAALTEAGGQLGADGGDAGTSFVLGRYQGIARWTVTADGAEVATCMCHMDRYSERAEALCAATSP